MQAAGLPVPTLQQRTECTPQQFMQEAKLAMAVKLFEMKCLSSGMSALQKNTRGHKLNSETL